MQGKIYNPRAREWDIPFPRSPKFYLNQTLCKKIYSQACSGNVSNSRWPPRDKQPFPDWWGKWGQADLIQVTSPGNTLVGSVLRVSMATQQQVGWLAGSRLNRTVCLVSVMYRPTHGRLYTMCSYWIQVETTRLPNNNWWLWLNSFLNVKCSVNNAELQKLSVICTHWDASCWLYLCTW